MPRPTTCRPGCRAGASEGELGRNNARMAEEHPFHNSAQRLGRGDTRAPTKRGRSLLATHTSESWRTSLSASSTSCSPRPIFGMGLLIASIGSWFAVAPLYLFQARCQTMTWRRSQRSLRVLSSMQTTRMAMKPNCGRPADHWTQIYPDLTRDFPGILARRSCSDEALVPPYYGPLLHRAGSGHHSPS
jgi:hypothetical protein